MAHRKSLLAALSVALLLVCASARPASAQLGTGGTTGLTGTGGTSGASTFSASDFFIGIQAVPRVNLSTFDAGRFFNKARCECDTPVYIFVSLLPGSIAKRTSVTSTTGTVSVVLGAACGTVEGQAIVNCLTLQPASVPVVTFLNNASLTIETTAKVLSTPLGTITQTVVDGGTTGTTGTTGSCSGIEFNQTINVNFDFDGDGTIDLNVPTTIRIDLSGPPPPQNMKVQGGSEALVMNWSQVDQSTTNDLLGYQILCSRADQYQVFTETPNDAGGSNGPFSASFVSCDKTRTVPGVEGLDPTFVCSPLLSAVATSYRVETLQNDITYAASVVAIDNSGNPSEPIVGFGKPVPTLSFYDVYRSPYMDNTPSSGGQPNPGGASGGFCAVAVQRPGWRSTFGALAAFGLGAGGLAFGRRRRRGRR
ncbi:MAG TPA: hypothetical protein VN962_26820 [Polyangia bacterium]|nr:hypothetical protein [Polyangia bacterium]